ncbi:nedd8-like protein [Diplodia corticola]|uniref:Nedd8-like protein n=1 Tax=Diplodia corticola TaxID=236234 RepID=A0A1J9RQ67_9PEZI|nr:nedd8-like protein [Diplodia corticola]OJD30052.1 nedd8-like protein [Diplodia corticola]
MSPPRLTSLRLLLLLLLLQAVSIYTSSSSSSSSSSVSIFAHAQTPPNNNTNQKIQWGPCAIDPSPSFQCGNVTVPLDWTDNASAPLTIELIKYVASKGERNGSGSGSGSGSAKSILVNFGGPGASGQQLMVTLGPVLQAVTGGHYDLISFDPRGAGKTIPLSCHKTAAARVNFTLQNPYVNGHESDTALGRLWASGQNMAAACADADADADGGDGGREDGIGGLLGFAFGARDYVRVAEVLGGAGGDGLVRYYGLSAGTVLGATIAAMFPDRIDRMVLDGVWNIHEYYHSHAVEGFTSTDATFTGFLHACLAAGPSNCALAAAAPPATNAADLEAATYALIERVKYHPIPHAGKLVDYTFVRNVVFLGQTTVAQWPALAAFLAALLFSTPQNATTALDAALQTLSAGEDPAFTESRFGIQCGDKPGRAAALADVLGVVEAVSARSRLAGDRIAFDVETCAQWRMGAKERYLGDFDVATRQPVLVIGNTYDPVTPLVSARNASASLKGSVLLEHHGFGHCSLQQVSRCTARLTTAYYENGTLPEPGTVCEVDLPPFSNVTWQDVLL